MDIVEFIQARLSEDWHLARQAAWYGENAAWIYLAWHDTASGPECGLVISDRHVGVGLFKDDPLRPAEAEHIARHDPARVLREVEAERALLDDLLAEPHRLADDWYTCRAYDPQRLHEDREDGTLPPLLPGATCTCGRDAALDRRLRLLATTWSDHPDYREEWRPTRG